MCIAPVLAAASILLNNERDNTSDEYSCEKIEYTNTVKESNESVSNDAIRRILLLDEPIK